MLDTLKKSFFVTAGLLVLAAAAGLYLNDSSKWRRNDGHTATVTAIWLPSPRNIDGVHIEVRVGGSLKVDKVFRIAPFHESYPIESGQRVEIKIRLVGTALASTMGCVASVDSLPEHSEAKEAPKTGDTLVCWAIAP